MQKNKRRNIINKIFLSAKFLYPSEKFGKLNIAIEKGTYLSNKNKYVRVKIVNNTKSDLWEDVFCVQGKKTNKTLNKMLKLLTKKIKETTGIKLQLKKIIITNANEKVAKIIKNLNKDIAFWKLAEKAEKEEVGKPILKKTEKPINNISSTEESQPHEQIEELPGEQLTFKF